MRGLSENALLCSLRDLRELRGRVKIQLNCKKGGNPKTLKNLMPRDFLGFRSNLTHLTLVIVRQIEALPYPRL